MVWHSQIKKATISFTLCTYAELLLLMFSFTESKALEGPLQHHNLTSEAHSLIEEKRRGRAKKKKQIFFQSAWFWFLGYLHTFLDFAIQSSQSLIQNSLRKTLVL